MALIDPSVRYAWCPEYTLRRVPQRLMVVWLDNPKPVGTDFLSPNIDDAELVADELNLQLGFPDRDAWRPLADAYINETCNGAPILLKAADFAPFDEAAADKGLQTFLPAYGDIAQPLQLSDSLPELSASLLTELAYTFDQLSAETDDNLAFQRHHLETLRNNPGAWTHAKLRIHRAEQLLEHYRTVGEHFVRLRTKIAAAHQELTGEDIEFAPNFPARPEAQADLAAATSPYA